MIVGIYCRTATNNEGAAAKLAAQEAVCHEYCRLQGLEVSVAFHEVAVGTTYRNRQALSLILNPCRQNNVQGIVVASSDRISRLSNQRDSFTAELAASNTTLFTVQEERYGAR